MAQSNDLSVVIFLIGGGWGILFYGLRATKLRRKMQDTPTAKIMTAAIGSNVEIIGNVLCSPEEVIESPLTLNKCYAFVWDLQILKGFGKSKYWATIHHYYSTPILYLKDESGGIAALDIAACEFHEEEFDGTFEFDDATFSVPDAVKEIFNAKNIFDTKETWGALQSSKYRLREKIFHPHQRLYVLGTAHIPPITETTFVKDKRKKFGIKQPNLIPQVLKRFDKNKDSILDKEESDALFEAIEKKLLEDYAQSGGSEYLKQSKIFFSEDKNFNLIFELNNVFVSNRSKRETLSDFTTYIELGLIIGPVMIVVGILLILAELKVF